MSNLSPLIRDLIDQKLQKLESLRPLPSSAVKKLQEQFEIEMMYNSNAIEDNRINGTVVYT